MIVSPIRTRIFREGEDLIPFIAEHLRGLEERAVLAMSSKVVALSEGRVVKGGGIAMTGLIQSESDFALPTKHVWLTIKDGLVTANAGIDESNAATGLVLLPRDSYEAASRIRKSLQARFGVKELGVVITDSGLLPLRAGVIGVALGYAGFHGVRDYRGKPDLFGREMKFSSTNVADGLATAATLVMGEGDERMPMAVIEEAPVEFCDEVNRDALKIETEDDMFGPLFSRVKPKDA
jgi:coenzyme F420-0:L-glutamate ligase